MNIIVCIKRVPSTETKVKIGSDNVSLDPVGVEYVLNPYDEFAVEEALKLKEKSGEGTVTVLTVGPSEAQKEIRTCLAMGADKGILIKDDQMERRDACAVSKMLAAQIKGMPHDVILFGKQAVDQDNSQVGHRVATILGVGCVGEVVKLDIEGKKAVAEKEVEGGREIVECSLPAAFTAQKGLNEPRYANLKGIMAAKKKPLEEISPEAVDSAMKVVEFTLPPQRAEGRILGEGAAAVPELIKVLKEEVRLF